MLYPATSHAITVAACASHQEMETGEMKRRGMTSALVAALVLMAALAVGLTSGAAAGTLVHASKHKAKPKAISCRALIAPSLLTQDITVDTGIAPEVDPVTEINPHLDKRGPRKGITLRLCGMYWANDGYGNGTAYGNCQGCGTSALYWYAGTAVTKAQFNRLYNAEDFNSTLGSEGGGPFTKQRLPSLGYGSRAFLRTNSDKAAVSNPKYQSSYVLFVLSKGKHGKRGNLVVLYAWPLSLQREEQIVTDLLSHNRF
jgi:hypothetical protein